MAICLPSNAFENTNLETFYGTLIDFYVRVLS